MKIIDAHHHLWDIENNPYPWLQGPIEHFAGDFTPIQRSYVMSEYLRNASEGPYELVKSVHVQCEWDENDSAGETAWLQSVADDATSQGMPNGIVGYADFLDPDVEVLLEKHASYPNCRGIRQALNFSRDNPRLNFIDRPDAADESQWRDGYRRLARFDMSFDLQVWPWQMEMADRLLTACPEVPAILDHAGLPYAHDAAGRRQWEAGIRLLAQHEHLSAKISALGMTVPGWTADFIRPYVLGMIDIFGTDRCMFSSNFPVDSLTSDFTHIWSAYDTITSNFSEAERRNLFHDNAEKYYRI